MTATRFVLRHPDIVALTVLVVGYPIVHAIIRVLS